MIFGPSGARLLRPVFSGRTVELVVPLRLAALTLWDEACYVFVVGVLEAALLDTMMLADCMGSTTVMKVDARFAQYFVNFVLAQVLLFRKRFKSVADVLEGVKTTAFTRSGWEALLSYWDAVSSWSLWPHLFTSPLGWVVSPDMHGLCNWVFDFLDVLNDFTTQVVDSLRDAGVRKWTNWLRDHMGSRLYDFF